MIQQQLLLIGLVLLLVLILTSKRNYTRKLIVFLVNYIIKYCFICLNRHNVFILGDSNRSVTNTDLNELVYLECAIKESLRLYPPVPYIAREAKENANNLFCPEKISYNE